MLNCHLCEKESEFVCDRCGEPVCYDCCVKTTIHNQIDYPLCELCGEVQEEARADYYQQQEDAEEAERAEKKKRADVRRLNYWKPENVEKRHAAKIERKRKQAEQREKMFKEAVGIVNSMFRGM